LSFFTQNPDARNRDSLRNVAYEFHLYMADNLKRNNCTSRLLVLSYKLSFGTGGTPCILFPIYQQAQWPIEFFFRCTSYACVSGWGPVFMRL
jgi:hypothetical protein